MQITRKLIKGAAALALVAGAAAGYSTGADAQGGAKLQAMYGGPGDPNTYCNGECATGGCCIVQNTGG